MYGIRSECDTIFVKHKPTHVIHLAAKVGGLFANMSHKVEFYRENIMMNDNVMECCRIHKVEKLVSYLSTRVFPDKTTYPIDETMLHSGPPHRSNEGYAYARRMVDTMNRAYTEEVRVDRISYKNPSRSLTPPHPPPIGPSCSTDATSLR